jgi:radical SAM protein with 4Fe4S-binding SPASM domain
LQRIIPFGKAKDSYEYSLSKKQVWEALNGVANAREKLKLNIMVEDPFPLCILSPEHREFMHPCEWGYTKAALNGQGDLTRCGADTRYNLGNVFKQPLAEIWETSPILKSFRQKDYLPQKCKTCDMFADCGGGCSLSSGGSSVTGGVDYLFTQYATGEATS